MEATTVQRTVSERGNVFWGPTVTLRFSDQENACLSGPVKSWDAYKELGFLRSCRSMTLSMCPNYPAYRRRAILLTIAIWRAHDDFVAGRL